MPPGAQHEKPKRDDVAMALYTFATSQSHFFNFNIKSKSQSDDLFSKKLTADNPYLHTSLTALVKKLADPALVPESLPETQIIGARVGEEPKAADATTTATKEKSSFANDMQKMLDEPDFQKYLVPCMYLGAATLALYVHVQYLAVVGSEAAPMLTVIVWIMVPMAIIAFVQMTQSHPGAWPKRPIGRSAVEEIMGINYVTSSSKILIRIRFCSCSWGFVSAIFFYN